MAIIWLARDIRAEIAGMKQEEGPEEGWENNLMTKEYKTEAVECGDIWAESAKRIEL